MDSIIPLLVQRGISLEMRNATGETPLFSAIRINAPSTVRVLLAAGANIQARDKLGILPSMPRYAGMQLTASPCCSKPLWM